MTDEKLAEQTERSNISPLVIEAFITRHRRDAHVSADHAAQILAALYRFKVRLVRRMQYATIEEQTQPGVVDTTRARLADERAALASLNVHGFAQLNGATARRDEVGDFMRKNGDAVTPEERKQLRHLMHAVDVVVTSTRAMLEEAKSVLAAYTEATQKLSA